MSIKIITDSTCDIPESLVQKHNITVVPAYVNIGSDSYKDGVELNRDDFYAQLSSYATHPTSAAPSPGEFAEAYQTAISEGATEIISIHVSSALSGMLNAAKTGAEMLPNPEIVTRIDSRQLSMGLGFQVLAAARAAMQLTPVPEIVRSLEALQPRIQTFCLLDSLEAVQRGGRISWLQMSVANLLRIKPILAIKNGEVIPAAQTRTRKRAYPKLRDIIADLGPLSEIAFLNTNAPTDIASFKSLVKDLIPSDKEPIDTIACPAIGVHAGARAIGVACVTR